MDKSIAELEKEIIEEFSLFEDRMQKYEHIIELGKDLPSLPADKKTDLSLVKGCQSKVWLHARAEGQNIVFDADADAFIAKGLIGLLLRVFSGQKIEDVMKTDASFIQKIGLSEMLSPTRSNGLSSMVKQMKLYAIALNSTQQVK